MKFLNSFEKMIPKFRKYSIKKAKRMTKSLTEGKPLPLILKFMLPLLLGNLFQQTYNTIDAAIVGQVLGENALAGVGASSSVQFLILGFCIGICCGFGVPISQRFGAQDFTNMKNYVFHSCVLAIFFAILLTTVCALLCPQILKLMSTPDEIYEEAYTYLLIIFLGIPFILLYNLMASILRAVGDSKTPFLFLAFSTCVNIGLDLFFIIVLKWGVAGAATATVTAQGMSGILCMIYILRKVPILHLEKENRKFQSLYIKNLLIMGVPMGLQYSITAIGSMVMQSSNNSLGTVYITGFTAGTKIKQFLICPFDALATSVCTFCGQNLGAGKMDRVKKGIKDGLFVGICYGIAAGLVLIFFGRTLSCLFVSADSADVLDVAARYLRCMGYCFWVLGILNVVRQAVQGLGYAGRAVFAGVVEMFARCIVCLVFVPTYGYSAICWADQSAWIAASLYLIPVCLHCIHILEKKGTSQQETK